MPQNLKRKFCEEIKPQEILPFTFCLLGHKITSGENCLNRTHALIEEGCKKISLEEQMEF